MSTEAPAPARHLTQEEADELAGMHLDRLLPLLELVGGTEPIGHLVELRPDPRGGNVLAWTETGRRVAETVRELAEQSAETLAEAIFGQVPGTVSDRRLSEAQAYCAVLALTFRGLSHQGPAPAAEGLRDAWVAYQLHEMLRQILTRHGAEEVTHV